MRTLLFCLLIISISQAANGQNTIAKIKFEEAEKAFYDGNYQSCLTLLDETEEILGQSAPNILFLRIMAGNEIRLNDTKPSFNFIRELRNQTNEYLTKYDITGMEGKYKEIYEVSKELAEYPSSEELFYDYEDSIPEGGMMEFYNAIYRKLKYPKTAIEKGVEGVVKVQFWVEKDGSIADAKIVDGIGAGCDQEALRVMKSAPNWIPAKRGGRPVRSLQVVNLNFRLG